MDEENMEDLAVHALSLSQEPRPPASTGEQDAEGGAFDLEEIYQQHHRRVLNAAYRITGNATDAEDVLQTVFLRLARREVQPGPAHELGPYLHRAAVNAALDMIRARKRSRAVPLEEADAVVGEERVAGPEKRSQHRQILGALRGALARLSPRAAEIFTLRFIEGYGNKEIALMLGTSQTAVGVTLHRVRGELRTVLATFGGQPS